MSFERRQISELTIFLNSGISRPFYEKAEGRPVLRSNNVKFGKVNCDDLRYWHEIDPRGANLILVSPQYGDLLVNFVNGSSSELGKSGIYRGKPENCIVTTNFFIVRFDVTKIIPDYANYFFQSDIYRKWLYINSGFSGQGSFNRSDFSKLEIPTPKVSQQRDVVACLKQWDEAIESTERLIAAKQRRLASLTDRLLFGQQRLGGRQTSNCDRYRWFTIPDNWKNPHIGELAEQCAARNVGGSSIPVLSCTKYDGLVHSLSYFGRQIFSEDTSTYKVVRRGEFAYATNHLEEGSIGYLDFLDEGLVSPMYTVFRTASPEVSDRFLMKVFKTGTFLHIFRANTSSSVDRRGGLRWEDFAQIRVPLPGLEEQTDIDRALTIASEEVKAHRAQRAQLERQKRGLMQNLLTGEWRVPLGDSDLEEFALRAEAAQ